MFYRNPMAHVGKAETVALEQQEIDIILEVVDKMVTAQVSDNKQLKEEIKNEE